MPGPIKTKLEDAKETVEDAAEKVDDPSQSARAFYVSSSEPKD